MDSGTVITYPYTGDYRVDVLLEGLQYRWNAPGALGSPVTVTYSFMSATPIYGGTNEGGDTGFTAFTLQQRTAVRQIMSQLQQELGITLAEVPDSTLSYGQIRFGNNTQQISSGYSWLPYSTGDDRSGDVWIDDSIPQYLTQVSPGSPAYETLLHEIGHALGLKHPGNYNAGSPSYQIQGNFLAAAEDNDNYTLMSYTGAAGGQMRDWYGMYDLLALKTLYGSRSYNVGDTVHPFADSAGRVLKIINDTGGTDTLDISALGSFASRAVDMRPGAFSSVGLTAYGGRAVNNLSIDVHTVIERFVGTAYADTVVGNDAGNVFMLGAGANVADGGAGVDLVVYGGSRGAYQVGATGATIQVAGSGVSDTLTNMERLGFADGNLAFDLTGSAGIAAKILGAVFGAPAVRGKPDYVAIGLGNLDAGMSYADLVALALGARLGAVQDEQLVQLLYTNVLGVAPTPDQQAPYLAELRSGAQTYVGLGMYAAESAPNIEQVGLAALTQSGLLYI